MNKFIIPATSKSYRYEAFTFHNGISWSVCLQKKLTCENAIQLMDEHTSFLVGDWKWSYTERRKDYGTGNQFVDTIFNDGSDDEYSISFSKNGNVTMYINNEIEDEFCIVDTNNTSINSTPSQIHMNLFLSDEESENTLKYVYKKYMSDTILINIKDTKFPFYYEVSNDEQIFYKNYFKKH